MKKTGLIAAIAALSAAAGALAVGALYLRRREQELDEYEELLFGDEDPLAEDDAEVEEEYEILDDTAPEAAAEEAPAEEAAE